MKSDAFKFTMPGRVVNIIGLMDSKDPDDMISTHSSITITMGLVNVLSETAYDVPSFPP